MAAVCLKVEGRGQIWDPGGSRVGLGTEEVVDGVHDILFKNPQIVGKNWFEKI